MTTTTTLEQASSFLIVHSSGLEPLHLMTLPIWYELRVDLEDWEGNTASATYSNFYVRSVNYGYSMYYDNFSGGNAGKEVNKQTNKQQQEKKQKEQLTKVAAIATYCNFYIRPAKSSHSFCYDCSFSGGNAGKERKHTHTHTHTNTHKRDTLAIKRTEKK